MLHSVDIPFMVDIALLHVRPSLDGMIGMVSHPIR